MKLEDILKKELESIDHDHISSSSENPIREDAFDISEAEKIKLIAEGFAMVDIFDAKEIGQALGRDNTVHGVVASGGIASRLIKSTDRLMAFRGPKS